MHVIGVVPWLIVLAGVGVMLLPWALDLTTNRLLGAIDVYSGFLLCLYAVWIAYGQLTAETRRK